MSRSEYTHILELPEILSRVLEFSNGEDILRMRLVSKRFYWVGSDHRLWKSIVSRKRNYFSNLQTYREDRVITRRSLFFHHLERYLTMNRHEETIIDNIIPTTTERVKETFTRISDARRKGRKKKVVCTFCGICMNHLFVLFVLAFFSIVTCLISCVGPVGTIVITVAIFVVSLRLYDRFQLDDSFMDTSVTALTSDYICCLSCFMIFLGVACTFAVSFFFLYLIGYVLVLTIWLSEPTILIYSYGNLSGLMILLCSVCCLGLTFTNCFQIIKCLKWMIVWEAMSTITCFPSMKAHCTEFNKVFILFCSFSSLVVFCVTILLFVFPLLILVGPLCGVFSLLYFGLIRFSTGNILRMYFID